MRFDNRKACRRLAEVLREGLDHRTARSRLAEVRRA